MKTLIINGSPNKNGQTSYLTKIFAENINSEIKTVYTYYSNIMPCKDCRFCFKNPYCSINDDMTEIYKYIEEADNIVIASPVYFSQLSGSFLSFASRMQLLYASKYIRKDNAVSIKRKKGILIITGGGSTKIIEPIIHTADIILKEMNAELIGTVSSMKTDTIPSKEDKDALNKIIEISKTF